MTEAAERFYMMLGRGIQEARRQRGMTQEGLGGMLVPALSRAAIANIETGQQGVLVYALAQIALALGKPVDTLMPPLVVVDSERLQVELTTKLPREIGERLHEQLSRLPETGDTIERPNRQKRS